ncbi:MAG: 4-hydroxy-tetrahydrodipicolinate synthase [Oscillospiraceae bacterium]|nr:4-hydroxy-tetrahydrodipicolinate synthase [Oscillospiraceae bacterium]
MSKDLIFKGSGVALVTPMLEDGSINYNKLYELIDFHIDSKTDAIIIAGTTGESSTLTDDEYISLLNNSVKHASSRIKIIAGSGSNSTAKSIFKSQQAKFAGVDALLIVTPYYNKTSQDGLVKHYFSIAESVKMPIILYNVPSRTGLNIEPETYLKLSEHPNIVATKEASGNLSKIAKTISLCTDNKNNKNNLIIYSGNDDQIVPILSLGGQGVISVAANIFPTEIHDICNLFFENKISESAKLQINLIPIIEQLFKTVNPVPIKQAMNLLNMNVGKCRLPLTSMTENNIKILKSCLDNYKINFNKF